MQNENSNTEQNSNSVNTVPQRSWAEFQFEYRRKQAMSRSYRYSRSYQTEVDPYTGKSFPVADRE